jgi:PDZ domain-containing secreted protein
MSDFKLEGKVIAIMDEQQITDTFKKREFVIETDDKYPQQVKFELANDKTDLISKYKAGDKITVSFNVRGRAWKDKYFVSLDAWRIEGETSAPAQAVEAQPQANDDDLPF